MAQEKWNFDTAHSTIGFSVRHLMIAKVHGTFKMWEGTLLTDEANPTASKIDVKIDAASVETRDPKRDEHLRSADFFDAGKYPELTFHSSKIEKIDQESYKVTGMLTIHGVSKEVALEAEIAGRAKDPWGGERAGFSAQASIDRKDFGLVFNMPLDGGGVLVGDKVEITLDLEAVKSEAL